jgi:EF hand
VKKPVGFRKNLDKIKEITMRLSRLWIPTVVLLCSSSWTMAAGESATEEPTTTIPDFKQVDQDRNGSISPMEATEVPGLVEQFTRVDRDRDGRLNVEEYEALVPGTEEEEGRQGAGT